MKTDFLGQKFDFLLGQSSYYFVLLLVGTTRSRRQNPYSSTWESEELFRRLGEIIFWKAVNMKQFFQSTEYSVPPGSLWNGSASSAAVVAERRVPAQSKPPAASTPAFILPPIAQVLLPLIPRDAYYRFKQERLTCFQLPSFLNSYFWGKKSWN